MIRLLPFMAFSAPAAWKDEKMKQETVLIAGASRGLGAALTRMRAEAGDKVIALSRSGTTPSDIPMDHVVPLKGDVTDPGLPRVLLDRERPRTLVLCAGVLGPMASVRDIGWKDFSATWNTDVRATLQWCQAALAMPMSPGSHVIVVSSAAARVGSPLAGGYAGAKRMQWLLTDHFREEGKRAGLRIRFTTVLPRLTGDTDLSAPAVKAYAKLRGMTKSAFLASLGAPFTVEMLAEQMSRLIDGTGNPDGETYFVDGAGLQVVT